MVVIIKTGFQLVDTSVFRPKMLSKGKKLLESFHVSEVQEAIDENNNRTICGLVLRETPGVASAKNNENVYKVKIELNANRSIADTKCNCKGGMGYCKHAAAVCIFVNTENAFSKTNEPMIWNKPSQKQLEKYQKGCKLTTLFSDKQSESIYVSKNIPVLSDLHMDNKCPLVEMVEAEKKYAAEREELEKIKLQALQELKDLLNKLYRLQNNDSLKEYNSYVILESSEKKLKLKKMTFPAEYSAQYSIICVDEEKWTDICIKSVGQSQSSSWFKERQLRITCSSKAHEIKTRKVNFEKLAAGFLNKKYQGKLTPDMIYGIKMEPVAASYFEQKSGAKVHHVGLVDSVKQPFLACSPDGIIVNNDRLELLEIKCPSSCKDSRIIDLAENSSEVPYLFFKDGDLQLKSHTNIILKYKFQCTF